MQPSFIIRRRLRAIFLTSLLFLCASFIPANAARAVTFGWQSLSGGGIEYIVQVEPDLLDTFARTGFTSDLPPGLHDVRSLRVMVGSDKLPHQGDTTGPTPVADRAKASEQPQGLPGVPGNTVGPPAGDGLNSKGTLDLPPPPSARNEGKAGGAAPQATFGGNQMEGANPGAVAADNSGGTAKSGETEPPAHRTGGIIPPLFQPGGWAKSMSDSALAAPGNSNGGVAENAKGANSKTGENAMLAGGGTESTTKPSWPVNNSETNTSSGQPYTAGHPSSDPSQTGNYNREQNTSDNWAGTRATNDKVPAEVPTPKPWWLLVMVLLVLFASIGANVYLVWIHQAVRAKYLSLIDEMPRQAAAT